MQGRVFTCDWSEKVKKDTRDTMLGAVAMSGIGMIDFKTKLCPQRCLETKGKALFLLAVGPRVANLGDLQAKQNRTMSVLKWGAL